MALLLNLSALQSLKEINEEQQEIHFMYYILLLAQKSSIERMEKLPEPWENVFYLTYEKQTLSA